MSIHTRIEPRVAATVAAVALAGLLSPFTPHTSASEVALAATREAFTWPGIYDLTAVGYPDGERTAVIHVTRADTTYSLVSLQGPPGSLVRFNVTGDSAQIVWNLGPHMMFVDLRGSGDSLAGEWSSGDWSGTVRGVRRR